MFNAFAAALLLQARFQNSRTTQKLFKISFVRKMEDVHIFSLYYSVPFFFDNTKYSLDNWREGVPGSVTSQNLIDVHLRIGFDVKIYVARRVDASCGVYTRVDASCATYIK